MFTIGTDPEFTMIQNGVPVSSLLFVTGKKNKPFVLQDGTTICNDGALVEFGSVPQDNVDDFIRSVQSPVQYIKDLYNVQLSARPMIKFRKVDLDHPECWQFGCDPDFSIYKGMSRNDPPELTRNNYYRPVGGHVHIGSELLIRMRNSGDIASLIAYSKILDSTVGLVSAVLDADTYGRRRRAFYGQAGTVRVPSHGIEYRTPSSRWVRTSESIALIFKAVETSFVLLADNHQVMDDVQVIINTCDSRGALQVLRKLFNPFFIKELISQKKMVDII